MTTILCFMGYHHVNYKTYRKSRTLLREWESVGSLRGRLLGLSNHNAAHKVLKRSKMITYADDTVIYKSSNPLNEIRTKLSEDRNSLKSWYDSNELVINLEKRKDRNHALWNIKETNKLESKVMEINLNGSMEPPAISTSRLIWIKLWTLKVISTKSINKLLVG